MTWFGWLLLSFLAFNATMVVLGVGKPCRPTRPWVALVVLIVDAFLAWGAVVVGTT